MTITTHHLTLTLYPRHLHRHLNIAGLLLTRCTLCGRYEVGVPLGACAVCGGRRRLATVGELFEGESVSEDRSEDAWHEQHRYRNAAGRVHYRLPDAVGGCQP